jgi:hypothetical protein
MAPGVASERANGEDPFYFFGFSQKFCSLSIMQTKKRAGVIGVGSFVLVATVVVVQMWRLHAGNV